MKYLLRHKTNIKPLPQNIKLLDCGGTLEDIFREHKEGKDIFAIDLEGYDELDLIIVNSTLKNNPSIYAIEKDISWVDFVALDD
jgi:hypothetical protein